MTVPMTSPTSQPMSEPNAQTRHAQYLQDTSAASARALSGRPHLHTRGAWFFDGEMPLPLYAAHLSPDEAIENQQQLLLLRARADAVALRLQHCDEALHAEHCPSAPMARLIFELLEQLRCESLATLVGVRHNVHEGFQRWSQRFVQSEASQSAVGILLLTVSQVAYSRLNACMIEENIADAIESTRGGIVATLASHFAALRRQRAEQAAFIPHALAIARAVNDSIVEAQNAQSQNATAKALSDSDFQLPLDFTPPPVDAFPAPKASQRQAADKQSSYRVWTREYDDEKPVGKLVRAALLEEYQTRLAHAVSDSRLNVPRLARVFRQLLARPQDLGWQFDEEDGYLDARRLSQLVTQSANHRIFKQIHQPPATDCQVTLLIDCSGSMKTHVEHVAPFADVLARLFELAGADSEILGFSTRTWNGGRPLKDWRKQGQPDNPGRLNETLHLIFKPAQQVYKRAKLGIGGLYKSDLFREGVDGEALEWAIARLYARPVSRRILFVLSDGCPMDSATEIANPKAKLLEQHLSQVVSQHDGNGVEIYGLGLGLDLSLFYRHRLAFEPQSLLSQQSFLEIAQMMRARVR
ncbi:MAG: cobalt chelatase [Gammaproteobacteria bacterium]|nr:MAG: cobalt chelatase [Gammaproteobacteria bacterium]